MSRAIPAGLLSRMQGSARTLAWIAKLTRTDGQVFGFTTHDETVHYDGLDYLASPGLDVAALVSSAGFAVDNTEIRILADGVIFARADVLAGRWDGCEFRLMRLDPNAVADGVQTRMVGTLGNLKPSSGLYVAELRGLRQQLQASAINVTQPTCRNRLGDTRCGVDMAAGGRTVSGTLTHVTSAQVVRDSARAEAAGFFSYGKLTMTTGDNAGLSFKVRQHAADGTLTLDLPSVFGFSVGDAYTLTAGCSKRLAEDCVGKFGNAVNFNGEPHLPGMDQIVAGGGV